jgi:hypothetical protein
MASNQQMHPLQQYLAKVKGQLSTSQNTSATLIFTNRILIVAGSAALSIAHGNCVLTSEPFQPLFLSTPIFLGGLGLPPSSIGKLLSIQGILNGIILCLGS